jgi:hypothetical protein
MFKGKSAPYGAEMVKDHLIRLLDYCRERDWAGMDPYDALNSRVFNRLPFSKSRLCRIAFIQAMKRSPINLRRVLLVPDEQNPKALALFLRALLKVSGKNLVPDEEQIIGDLIEDIAALRSTGTDYWCWGYSFPWQTRTIIVPRGYPNLVCTTFVAEALLDAFEHQGRQECLHMAKSAAEYILKELYWTSGDSLAGFSYPLPSLRSETHNANLLAAALFCRIYHHTGDDQFLAPALRVARYSIGKQRGDGSWLYGEGAKQNWIDNFHTGFNLGALRTIARSLNTSEFEENLHRGFRFYRKNFFLENGTPKYFHNRTYPIDVHAVAQSIITLVDFQDLDPSNAAFADSIFEWAVKHMWSEQGFFYYRLLRLCTIRTSYMRWSQAWMALAMATLAAGSQPDPEQNTELLEAHK